MKAGADILVFSDLDGTLLDHETYSWAPALPVLREMRRRGHGLILATSKTAAEVAPLRDALGFADWPAIVENGAGILEAGAVDGADSGDYRAIRNLLRGLPPGFVGFGDMSVAEVRAATGLATDAAALARRRCFTEPGVWTGPEAELPAFLAKAQQAGLHARRGGRFLTLSFGATKADQMHRLCARYQTRLTVALGDAPNDVEMLEAADLGVIVYNPEATPLPALAGEAAGRIRRTRHPGPAGWAEALGDILNTPVTSKDAPHHG